MEVQEAYIYIKDRLNKFNSSKDINERQFLYAYNKMIFHWYEERLKVAESTQIRQEELQQYLENICEKLRKDKTGTYLKLPEDYYTYSRVKGICGDCDNTVIGRPAEEGNINNYLQLYPPSLEWEETWFTVRDNKLYFYTDFTCKEVELIYYKCPRLIDMDCVGGKDIHPDLDKASIHEVLDLVVLLLSGDAQDPRYQTISNLIKTFT